MPHVFTEENFMQFFLGGGTKATQYYIIMNI